MKRRYYVSVLDTLERKVIITGNLLPVDAIVSASEYVTMDLFSNKPIQDSQILFEQRQEEIFLTMLSDDNAKGIAKVIIPYKHDFIICHGKYTCRYLANECELKVLYWEVNRMVEKVFKGKLQRIHVGEKVKASFEEYTEYIY